MHDAVVTVPDRAGEADHAAAAALAARAGLPLVERRGLTALASTHGVSFVLVAGARGCALYAPPDPAALRFHGSLGVPRLRALHGGGRDALVDALGLRPGDHLVDATAGALADALVCAFAVGEAGRVTALESSALLFAVMSCGLAVPAKDPRTEAARRRITLLHEDHARWLGAQPPRSADAVLFDPMFRLPAKAAPGFERLRTLADPRPLTPEAVQAALRVARRRVVLVDHPGGGELARLGFEALPAGRGARRRFGVLETCSNSDTR